MYAHCRSTSLKFGIKRFLNECEQTIVGQFSPTFSVYLSAKTIHGVDPKKFGGECNNGRAIPYVHTMFDGDEQPQAKAAVIESGFYRAA